MEVTNEIRAKVFAMYMGCEFVFKGDAKRMPITGVLGYIVHSSPADYYHVEDSQLILTSISEIRKDHAIELSRMFMTQLSDLDIEYKERYDGQEFAQLFYEYDEEYEFHTGQTPPSKKRKVVCNFTHKGIHHTLWSQYFEQSLKSAEYLRSKGYMIPYMGIDLFAEGIAITPEQSTPSK